MTNEAKARFYFPGYFDVNGFPLEYNTVDALRRATALHDAWDQRGEVARLRAIVSAFEGAIDERYAASAENSPERAEIKALKDAVFERAEHALTKEDGERAWDAEQAAKWPGVLKPATTPAAFDP